MEDINTRVENLEMSMREHTHSTLDSTSPLAKTLPVIQKTASTSTITPRYEEDCIDLTALAVAVTFNNPTGTPYNFKKLLIRIKDNGTARAITWGSKYMSAGFTLPTTTVISKVTTLGFFYNVTTDKWQLVGLAQEA